VVAMMLKEDSMMYNSQRDDIRHIIQEELPDILRNDIKIRSYLQELITDIMMPKLDVLSKQIQDIKNIVEKVQMESNKRWDENDKRWDENDKRWDENDKRWDENDKKWDKNEARLIAIENKLSKLDGRTLEIMYREKISSYFGTMLLRTKVIEVNHIVMNLRDDLSLSELKELFNLDILVRGRIWDTDKTILVAFEVSAVIDETDVTRALRRCQLLRKAGFPAISAVGGHESAKGIIEKAKQSNTVVLHNGTTYFWKEAITELAQYGPHTYPKIIKP
jgi:hypothetical protein